MANTKTQGEKIIEGAAMKLADGSKLESIEIAKTLSDEYGVYFCGEGQRKLAFPFSLAKDATFCVKKVSEQLGVKYNIAKEVQMVALMESKNPQLNKEREETKMADGKKGVNVKGLCRNLMDAGASKEEILGKIAEVYTAKGKDEKYAANRAKAYYIWICKERGLSVTKEKKAVEATPEVTEPQEANSEVTVEEAEQVVEPEGNEEENENEPESSETNEEVTE